MLLFQSFMNETADEASATEQFAPQEQMPRGAPSV